MSIMPKYAMTYVVGWPDYFGEGRHLIKVGRAWRFSRIQNFVKTGAQVLICARGTDASWEIEALRNLRRWFFPAFDSEIEAWHVLPYGRGWTECFEVTEHHLQLMKELIFEGFARGNDQGYNTEETEYQRERSAQRRVHARADGGEGDGVGAVDSHGSARSPRAGAGVDCGSDLSGGGGDGSGDRACADAGGVGVPDDVSGRRSGVDCVEGSASRGYADGTAVGVPGTAESGSSRFVATCRGCGGSGCTGACESSGEGERGAGAGSAGELVGGVGREPAAATGTTDVDRCTAARLSRTSSRHLQGLRTLRHCSPPPRPVGGSGTVHGSAGGLRGGSRAAGLRRRRDLLGGHRAEHSSS